MRFVFYARPHPDPLPRREGTFLRTFEKLVRHSCNLHVIAHRFAATNNLNVSDLTRDGRTFLPLPGVRAGVRAVVIFPN
jgi:hypothetical protein